MREFARLVSHEVGAHSANIYSFIVLYTRIFYLIPFRWVL